MAAASEIASAAFAGWRKLATLLLTLAAVGLPVNDLGTYVLRQRRRADKSQPGIVARYYFLTWFLTMVVVIVFVHQVGIGWLQRHYPDLSERLANHPLSLWLASGLTRLQ
jgi:hypothetical protein